MRSMGAASSAAARFALRQDLEVECHLKRGRVREPGDLDGAGQFKRGFPERLVGGRGLDDAARRQSMIRDLTAKGGVFPEVTPWSMAMSG